MVFPPHCFPDIIFGIGVLATVHPPPVKLRLKEYGRELKRTPLRMENKDVICVDICFDGSLFVLFYMFRAFLGGTNFTMSKYWPCVENNTFIPARMDRPILLHKDFRKVANRSVDESRMCTSLGYGGGIRFEPY